PGRRRPPLRAPFRAGVRRRARRPRPSRAGSHGPVGQAAPCGGAALPAGPLGGGDGRGARDLGGHREVHRVTRPRALARDRGRRRGRSTVNVHDINAKKDAAMLADLRAASTAIEPPASLDATTMAVRAVRTVRRRRLVTAVTAGAAALALLGAGLGAASTILGERQPLPGTDRTATRSAPTDGSSPGEPSPSPSSSATEPTRYLRTGDGELPVLPGVERGVVEEGGHTPYILGGLWYEVPGGGWI